MTRDEYNDFDDINNVTLKDVEVELVFMSDDEECPYVGVKYVDNTCSIVGCGIDQFCTYQQMIESLIY